MKEVKAQDTFSTLRAREKEIEAQLALFAPPTKRQVQIAEKRKTAFAKWENSLEKKVESISDAPTPWYLKPRPERDRCLEKLAARRRR